MPPVAMRMAKIQKATLDPTKVSGRCGRLKCCLRFEFETYDELLEQSPPLESIVETPDGAGKVVAQELLAQRVVVCLESGAHTSFAIKDVRVLEPCQTCRERQERHDAAAKNKGAKNQQGPRRHKRDISDDDESRRSR